MSKLNFLLLLTMRILHYSNLFAIKMTGHTSSLDNESYFNISPFNYHLCHLSLLCITTDCLMFMSPFLSPFLFVTPWPPFQRTLGHITPYWGRGWWVNGWAVRRKILTPLQLRCFSPLSQEPKLRVGWAKTTALLEGETHLCISLD